MTTNPTLTRTIEQAWLRDNRRRFKELSKRIGEYFNSPIVTNALNFRSFDSIEQQRIFMAWLQTQIESLFFADDWQSQYQLDSYNRALKRVRADLLRAGEDLTLTASELDIARSSDFDFSAVPSFGTSLPSQPIHQDALWFINNRALDKLRGITDQMGTAIRQNIFDGAQQGKGILEVVRDIKKEVTISETRARLIVRTETIQAHHQATANETDRLNEQGGKNYKLVWITARDERVRKLHAKWHGTVNTAKKTREMDAIQPFNCRCGQRIVTPRMLTDARLEKWSRERVAVMLLAA